MNEIMTALFAQYNFVKIWEENNKMFFGKEDNSVVSYFILNFVDCTNISNDEKLIRTELNRLEEEYVDRETEKRGIKYSIICAFENKQEVPQIDKNTSAIYLVKFSEVNMLDKYRNLIYSIEESPNYFKRYILPYTEKQVSELKKILSCHSEQNISEILSDLADQKEDYYSLMSGINNSVYELTIRLFSKIPFLQYKFNLTDNSVSLEKIVNEKLKDYLVEYDDAIKENRITIEELIALEDEDLTEKAIDGILNQLLEEVE